MNDLMFELCKYFDIASIKSYSCTCTRFYNIFQNEKIWDTLIIRDFNSSIRIHDRTNKEIYRICHILTHFKNTFCPGMTLINFFRIRMICFFTDSLTKLPPEIKYLRNAQYFNSEYG